jgi:hypothetical protein
MTPLSRLALSAANSSRAISSSPWHWAVLGSAKCTARIASEPKNSFIYNEAKPVPHPTKTPSQFTNSLQTNNQLASFRHSPIQIGVPSPTRPQISSISSSVTAMHPCVQSPSTRTPSRIP